MKRDELLQLLTQLAARDLADGATIYDHPCSVAIREIEGLQEELEKESFYARKQKALRIEQKKELDEIKALGLAVVDKKRKWETDYNSDDAFWDAYYALEERVKDE